MKIVKRQIQKLEQPHTLFWATFVGAIGGICTVAFRQAIFGLQRMATGHSGSFVATAIDGGASAVPGPAGWLNPLVFAAEDLDGDGKKELVVGRTKGAYGEADFYQGYLVQVLNVSGRTLTDVSLAWTAFTNASATTVLANSSGPTWIEWAWVADEDGDGTPDLVGSDKWLGSFVAHGDGGSFGPWQQTLP